MGEGRVSTAQDLLKLFTTGDPGSIPGLGRSPGEGKGYPLQYSGLENAKGLQSQAQLSDFHFTFMF